MILTAIWWRMGPRPWRIVNVNRISYGNNELSMSHKIAYNREGTEALPVWTP